MEFYQAKMQDLVLYKSRCDSRLNEVSERAVADKQEVESLAKKYEEKYRQSGGVASKLRVEEATFRDIQEKKMEMYQAISKIEQDGTDDLQVRADQIQSSLEELVRSLSESCKKYGLRSKPMTLAERPFGWQPGIQESSADSDEDWDKFEDEGYTFVKEMTVDVQNIIAPPKTRVKVTKKETNSASKSELTSHTSDSGSKPLTTSIKDKKVSENGVVITPEIDDMEKSSILRAGHDGPKDKLSKSHGLSDASPHDESPRMHGIANASFSEKKSFDEPTQGSFDTIENADSASGPTMEIDRDKHIDDLFGHGNWTLPPIKTSSSKTDEFLPKKGIISDSILSTPSDSFYPKKSLFDDSVPGTPAEAFFPKQSIFADSVPSTPLHGSNYSPQKRSQGVEQGFNFSRFDSFRSTDSGFQPQEKLSRFDSMRSTNNNFDYGDRLSFDDSDPFGSGPFKSSFGDETFRDSDGLGSTAFRSSLGNETPRSEVDVFGSVGPFRSTFQVNETPRGDSDPFGPAAPFSSSFGSETPRADSDPFGSVGPFGSSWANETPRSEADPFGGPFRSSFGSETPRRESDYFGNSGSFKTLFGNKTLRSEFDSYGFGGPFGSSLGSETPRGDFDSFGSSGPFKSTLSGETTKGQTDSWSAF